MEYQTVLIFKVSQHSTIRYLTKGKNGLHILGMYEGQNCFLRSQFACNKPVCTTCLYLFQMATLKGETKRHSFLCVFCMSSQFNE